MSELLWILLGIVLAFVGIGVWAFWDYRNETYWDEIYTGGSPSVTVKTRKVRADKGKKRKAYNKSKGNK
jgi:hypothetical protein